MVICCFKTTQDTTIGFSLWWMKHDKSFKTAHVQRGNGASSGHMCVLLVFSLTSSGNTGISRALFARTHAHTHDHVCTVSGRRASWFPQQQASPVCPPSPSLPCPLTPNLLIPLCHSSHCSSSFPTLPPRKESIETQSVFLMSAPARAVSLQLRP